ncbi:hypothetical protein K1719_036034 [Acacia pycnantha]|nr:hypothetical protein K1719_036034 [Acacia pycnantha]
MLRPTPAISNEFEQRVIALTEQKLTRKEEEEAIRRANAAEQNGIQSLRKVSRQEYLKKREMKKLDELRDDIEDEQYLFEGVKLTEAEYNEFRKAAFSYIGELKGTTSESELIGGQAPPRSVIGSIVATWNWRSRRRRSGVARRREAAAVLWAGSRATGRKGQRRHRTEYCLENPDLDLTPSRRRIWGESGLRFGFCSFHLNWLGERKGRN